MRIAILIYGDINTTSGGYLYDRKLVGILRSLGDEVDIISLKKISYLKALLSNSIPGELERYYQTEGQNKKSQLKLDVLIQDELVHPSFWKINHQLKRKLKCPIVSLVHLLSSAIPGGYYKKILHQTFERPYLKSVDAIVLNSQETLKQARLLLQDKLPLNLVAVPCGDNFNSSKQLVKNEDASKNTLTKKLNILFVGNITQQKGLHVLVKAMKQLDGTISLSVVGREDLDPRYIKNIRNYIKINKLNKQITFYGQLKEEALQQKYLEHDLFVLPSTNEAYGIVFVEAMQFSLPVIGCSLSGAKEIIDEGQNGFLVDPEDDIKLVELINRLNDDRRLLARMSESARQKYLLHPTWEESIKKIRKFLQELIKQEGSAFGQ